MRLESALFSSTSSMQSHGKALQVVGDNISNVNTIGYKASSVQFGDLLAEGEESHNSSADPVAGNGVYVASLDTPPAVAGGASVGAASPPHATKINARIKSDITNRIVVSFYFKSLNL